jgi:hypothetical protein
MDATLYKILVGGLLGIIGQGIRTVVGIKKMRETNALNQANAANATATNAANNAANTTAGSSLPVVTPAMIPGGEFEQKRFWISLFIGFIAGALSGLFVVDLKQDGPADGNNTAIGAVIAAGYAGVDFIEGMMTKLGLGKS